MAISLYNPWCTVYSGGDIDDSIALDIRIQKLPFTVKMLYNETQKVISINLRIVLYQHLTVWLSCCIGLPRVNKSGCVCTMLCEYVPHPPSVLVIGRFFL